VHRRIFPKEIFCDEIFRNDEKEDDGASAGFGVSGLSERAAEMGGRVTAGRIGDSFLLTLMLPYRQLATPLRPEAS